MDDSIVELAAEKSYDNYRTRYPGDPVWHDTNPEVADAWLADTRAALEAVAPLIAAKVWEEAAEVVLGPSSYLADAATCRSISNDLRARADALEAGQP